MLRILLTTLLLQFPAFPLQAQTTGDAVPDTTQAEGDSNGNSDDVGDAGDEEADVDDADLDEQTYEEDDDDFIPTEEIPTDEPIPFPSNI